MNSSNAREKDESDGWFLDAHVLDPTPFWAPFLSASPSAAPPLRWEVVVGSEEPSLAVLRRCENVPGPREKREKSYAEAAVPLPPAPVATEAYE
jgi:hypothetical protein